MIKKSPYKIIVTNVSQTYGKSYIKFPTLSYLMSKLYNNIMFDQYGCEF